MPSGESIEFMSDGKRIAAVFREAGLADGIAHKDGGAPCIVINHGYSGYKEEYDDLALALSAAGIATLQFDSRGCGGSEAELGRMLCGTEWILDADAAVTWATHRAGVDPERIGYAGCSMGAVLALYAASHDRRIKAAVDMCAFADGYALLEEQWTRRKGAAAWGVFRDEMEADAASVVSGKSSRKVSVPYALAMTAEDESAYMTDRAGRPGIVTMVPLESVRDSFLNLRPKEWCAAISAPVMVLHGGADSIVPPSHSEEIYALLRGEKDLVVFPEGPHGLPLWDRKEEVFRPIVGWFKRHLRAC